MSEITPEIDKGASLIVDPRKIALEVLGKNKDRIGEKDLHSITEQIEGDLLPQKLREKQKELGSEREREAIVALEAGKAAYLVVNELAGKVNPTRPKEDKRQILSLADELSSAILKESLTRAFPEYGYLDEEHPLDDALTQEKCWIVDPVDGSAAIIRNITGWAVGIALHESEERFWI